MYDVEIDRDDNGNIVYYNDGDLAWWKTYDLSNKLRHYTDNKGVSKYYKYDTNGVLLGVEVTGPKGDSAENEYGEDMCDREHVRTLSVVR